MSSPKFFKDQTVAFLGGSGKVTNYLSSYSNWFYVIEMNMGEEPDFGRIGYETTIIMDESELQLC